MLLRIMQDPFCKERPDIEYSAEVGVEEPNYIPGTTYTIRQTGTYTFDTATDQDTVVTANEAWVHYEPRRTDRAVMEATDPAFMARLRTDRGVMDTLYGDITAPTQTQGTMIAGEEAIDAMRRAWHEITHAEPVQMTPNAILERTAFVAGAGIRLAVTDEEITITDTNQIADGETFTAEVPPITIP